MTEVKKERFSALREHIGWHRTNSMHDADFKARVMQRYRRNKATREREARQHARQ